MIVFENVSKVYHDHSGATFTALNSISLKIPQRKIFGIIGSSGAGKSTLLRCINFLERPSSGRVLIDGQNLALLSSLELRQLRSRIGMIFQHFNLLASQTIFDNVALPLKFAGKKEISQKVMELLKVVGLSEKANAYPHQLSGGQKQRVAIARALANDPSILLCDEATSALDPTTTDDILKLLKRIHQEFPITLVFITHQMHVIKSICTDVAVIDQGNIIECSDVLSLVSDPKSGIAQQFLAQTQLPLPDKILSSLKPTAENDYIPLLKLSFVGRSTNQPVISDIVLKFQIKLNIHQSQLEYICDEAVGMMLLECYASEEQLPKIIAAFQERGSFVEVLGYVPRIISSAT